MSAIDTAQVDLMFTELHLPTIKAVWQPLATRLLIMVDALHSAKVRTMFQDQDYLRSDGRTRWTAGYSVSVPGYSIHIQGP